MPAILKGVAEEISVKLLLEQAGTRCVHLRVIGLDV